MKYLLYIFYVKQEHVEAKTEFSTSKQQSVIIVDLRKRLLTTLLKKPLQKQIELV